VQLLKERRGERLPNGGSNTLAKALASSESELKNRMQFAEQYPTRRWCGGAFKNTDRGVKSACAGWASAAATGHRHVRRSKRSWPAQAAGRQDPVGTRLPRIGEYIAAIHDELLETTEARHRRLGIGHGRLATMLSSASNYGALRAGGDSPLGGTGRRAAIWAC